MSRPAASSIEKFFGLGHEQTHKTETVFSADHPEVFAAEDNGITPIEYLLVGLASCLTAGVATFSIDADASKEEIEALVAQSQKRSAVYDALTNPTNVTVEVA